MQKIANSSNIKSKRKSTQKLTFNVQVFLDTAGVARKVIEFKKAEVVYSQGDAAKSIMYLQAGGIKLCLANCYFPSHRACNNVSCFMLLYVSPLSFELDVADS